MVRQIMTRKEAHALGLKRYYDGNGCVHGHDSERFVSNGGCIECQTFSSPNRRQGPKGTNVAWPHRGLVFTVPDVTRDEMTAAFMFIEAQGWHNAAVQELRKNPALINQYLPPLSSKEQAELQNALDNNRARLARLRGES